MCVLPRCGPQCYGAPQRVRERNVTAKIGGRKSPWRYARGQTPLTPRLFAVRQLGQHRVVGGQVGVVVEVGGAV